MNDFANRCSNQTMTHAQRNIHVHFARMHNTQGGAGSMQIDKGPIIQALTRKGHSVTEFSARTRSQEQLGEGLGPVTVTESSAFQLSSSGCATSQLESEASSPSLLPPALQFPLSSKAPCQRLSA